MLSAGLHIFPISTRYNIFPQLLQETGPVKEETKILQKPCIGAKYAPGREQDETKSTTVYCEKSDRTINYFSHY